jgi:phosphatidylglycerol:prolipoprotein diacylglycerol transferase
VYGIFVSLGILSASLIAEKIAKKRGKKVEILWGGLVYAVLSAVLGARIYHVVEHWSYYSRYPLRAPQIWLGGLHIFGALAGGVVGIALYARSKKENIAEWLDISSIVFPIGQAIGRWGNYFNQELFGRPTNLPWGIYIKPENRPVEYSGDVHFHPLFLYESLLSVALFGTLCLVYKRRPELVGTKFYLYTYLLGYSIIRFFMEGIRLESWNYAGINMVKTICVIIAIICTPNVVTILRQNKN